MKRKLLIVILGVATLLSVVHADDSAGEFDIPGVLPLAALQLESLRALVRTNPAAAACAASVREAALPRLDASPNPLDVIEYEGLVNTDPRRIATVAKLREMADVARLVRYLQCSEDPAAAAALLRFIAAWADVYRPTGNDVNENKLYPLLVAWLHVRGSAPAGMRESVDRWVGELGGLHESAVRRSEHLTNRYTKHIRLVAICALILERRDWTDMAQAGVRRFISESLYADGTSLDLKRRDTLTYHASALIPVLELAMLWGSEGCALYAWTAPQGGSLQKSVECVVPFALGTATREEWRHSTAALDRRRAEAGLEHYRPGRLYEPRSALGLMECAACFDPDLMRVVRHLRAGDIDAGAAMSWQLLLNAAIQSARASDPVASSAE